MKFLKNIFVLFMFLLKNQVSALGSLDTTLSGTDKSVVVTTNWKFDPGAYAKGFIAFQNGFEVAATSTLLFETPIPIVGTIKLNGGTLKLTNDIYLGKLATIQGPGFIDPSGASIYLMDIEFITGGTIFVTSAGTFVGNSNILVLDTTTGGALDFNHGWGLGGFMHNVYIRNVSNDSFKTPLGGASGLDNVTLSLVQGTVFDFNWNTAINGNCHITGPSSRFNLNAYTHITAGATLTIDPATTLRVGSPGGAIAFDAISSVFLLNSSSLEVNIFMQFRKGRFVIEGASTITGISGNILDIGDGVSESNDNHIFIMPGSTLELESGTEVRYRNFK